MADARLRIVIDALNKASGDLDKLKTDLKGVDEQADKAEGSTKKFGSSITDIIGTAAMAAAAIGGVYMAMKQVYETAREGADLLYVEDRFNRLAESAGMTADVLMKDLREATRGVKSDAELMAAATDFMALGLAKSHDEVVRLTNVAGALGMNMNQLVLTLTNQTTMRFDTLGVAVDGFDEKVKALEESGLSAQEAFSEAFLQQAEEQIEKVGHVADSAKGSFDRLEASFANMSNSFKKNVATAIGPAVESYANYLGTITDFHDKMTFALNEGIISEEEYNRVIGETRHSFNAKAEALEWLTDKTVEYDEKMGLAMAGQLEAYDIVKANELAIQAEADALIEAAKAAEEMNAKNKVLMSSTFNLSDLAQSYSKNLGKIASEVDGLESGYGDLVSKVQEAAAAHREATNQMIFDLMAQKMSADGLSDTEFIVLMNMAEDMGLIEEGAADAAIELDKMLDGVVEDGEVTDEELGLVQDHVNNLTTTVPGAQAVMDSMLEKVKQDGEVTKDELDDINEVLGELYTNSDERKRKHDEILTEFKDQAGEGKLNVEGIQVALATLNGKTFETTLIVNVVEVGGTVPQPGQAVGGAVSAGNPYLWQEYGYRGEVFVPSSDGFVLSRADAERILSKAAQGKGGNTYNYNLTMPTSMNPSDVIMAFELLQAYGGN